jgi:NAD(P)-dependent dehydrogenase (short-subunit alcohol dehydrogenase family)
MSNPKAPDPRERGKKPPQDEPSQSGTGSEAAMRQPPDFGVDSYRGLGRLEGRAALITGGDSGIGRAVALAYAREGADVVIAYREHEQDAKETLRWVEQAGRRGKLVQSDLSSDQGCQRLAQAAREAFPRIDVLVNNAAYQGKAVERFEDIDAERINQTFQVNIMAMFHLSRYLLPVIPKGGSIINVASIQAYNPSASILDYAATKGAIVTFTKGLAQELAGRGIRVNCVAPGPVWTPIVVQSFDEDKIKSFGKDSPFGRPAQPVELSPAFVFLASAESTYISGEVLGVTGGKPLA